MITEKQEKRLRQLINRHTRAQMDRAWMGAQDPESRTEIIQQADAAKAKLSEFINTLKEPL